METFITEIKVTSSRNIKNLNIPLSKEKRQHLILTGKNGSGKTSLLLELNKYLTQFDGTFTDYEYFVILIAKLKQQLSNSTDNKQRLEIENNITNMEKLLAGFGGTEILFSTENMTIYNQYQKGDFILASFDAKRQGQLTIPSGINKISLQKKYSLNESVRSNFLQYLVNLKADRSFARDDNEISKVEKIDNWFANFEKRLKYIFDVEELKLKFDRETYNFDIITNKSEPFNFDNLSDGYSAIISIISELILRMEVHNKKSYDLEGIVMIDEIETHLHVDLQKKILPFLIDFFPRIQFIVTTHSPFIISSVSNVTICDLEHKIVTTDLSKYSYDALIESYFDTDKYSNEIKERIFDFETLNDKKELTVEERINLKELRNYFAHPPKYLSNELMVKLQEIELKEITRKKGQ